MNAILGGSIIVFASFLFYLASPNRKIARGWEQTRALKILGAVGLVAGLALLLTWSGAATSIYIALTLIMAILTLAPLAIAWWLGSPKDRI